MVLSHGMWLALDRAVTKKPDGKPYGYKQTMLHRSGNP